MTTTTTTMTTMGHADDDEDDNDDNNDDDNDGTMMKMKMLSAWSLSEDLDPRTALTPRKLGLSRQRFKCLQMLSSEF